MLVLTRKSKEAVTIGETITVRVLEVKGKQVRLGIDAPGKYAVHREEIYIRIQAEIRAAK